MKNKKLNIIDVILITILVLVAVAVGLRAVSTRHLKSHLKDQQVVYTIEIYNIDKAFANSVLKNDKLYLTEKNLYCGDVISSSFSYSEKDVQYENATVKSHIYPQQINMTIKACTISDLSDFGFYVGDNTFITEGTVINMHTKTFSFTGKVTNITYPNN